MVMPVRNDEKILSVKDLTRFIKMKLESDELLQNVLVRGEISNFTHHSSGHMYFTLKDAGSRIKCIMFASQNQRLPFIPREGQKVIAGGSISVYERDGQYQFYISHMQPDGIGSLYLAFEQLKKKLEEEGLFAQERKKPIPRFPGAIGVVTSPTGAAIRDVLITLQRRYPAVPIIIFPVAVQGRQAAPSIARAIETMNRLREVDVLIVGRGGGSLEELWAFNEEIVARSIYQSKLPIISAVGHETDYTIADFVADLRAATPTAAAELAVPHVLELKQQLYYLSQRLHSGIIRQLNHKKDKLRQIRRSPYFMYPRRHLLEPAERLDRIKERLVFKIRNRLGRSAEQYMKLERALLSHHPKEQAMYASRRLESGKQRLMRSMQMHRKENKQRLSALIRYLDALSPLKIMDRGYSLVYDEKQKTLIKSLHQVQPGDLVKVKVTDGVMDCHVWSMKGDEDHNGAE
jgi:exodeoxyribonuclease VII large subunit